MLVCCACLLNKLSEKTQRFNSFTLRLMEVVRLVEGAVLKTVGCKSFGGSIPSASAYCFIA